MRVFFSFLSLCRYRFFEGRDGRELTSIYFLDKISFLCCLNNQLSRMVFATEIGYNAHAFQPFAMYHTLLFGY